MNGGSRERCVRQEHGRDRRRELACPRETGRGNTPFAAAARAGRPYRNRKTPRSGSPRRNRRGSGLWVGAHFIGIGEIIDILLLAAGVFAIGLAVFDGVGELAEFSTTALGAGSDQDLDRASIHFAHAVTILGIQAVLAVLFRGAPRTYSGGRLNVGPAPTATLGRAYRPVLRSSRNLPAGAGVTNPWGDIVISRLGAAADRRLVALHENVHRVLTPKLYVLREFRIQNRTSSYTRSTLSKYLEEALAETIAQVGVNGFREVFKGISFPIREKYVTLVRSERIFTAQGVEIILPIAPEAAGLFAGSILIGGIRVDLYTTQGRPVERPR